MQENRVEWSIPVYLDASVAVKLAVPEEGSVRLEEFIGEKWACFFYITEFAFYESLSVLKQKLLRHELAESNYFGAIATITGYVEDGRVKIDADFRPDSFRSFPDIFELAKKHSLDWSDVLQIHTVLKGKWAGPRHECTAIFVTADEKLARAAREEGLRVWNPVKETDPPGMK